MTDLQTVLPLLALIPEPLKIGHFTFHARGPLQKALANGKLDKADLPFAPELLPDEPLPIAGKMIPAKAMLLGVLADGKFGPDDLLRILAAWSGAPPAPVAPAPAPVTPPVIAIAPDPPAIPRPLYPSGLSINFEITDPFGDTRPYELVEHEDHYEVKLGGGTSNLPLRSRIDLSAGYLDATGKPFRFEDQVPPALHLYNTARWVSRGISGPGAGRVSVMSFDQASRKYVQVDGAGGRIVNWHNQGEECQMATRHNGMDVPMKIPAEADETVIETGLEVDTPLGTKAAKPVRWPKAS